MQTPASSRPRARWRRARAADLLRTPSDTDARHVEVRSFLLADTLPNGLPRDAVVVFPFLLRVGDCVIQARVERAPGGPILAVERHAYNLRRRRWEAFNCPAGLQAETYREAGRQYVSARARRHASSAAGRN